MGIGRAHSTACRPAVTVATSASAFEFVLGAKVDASWQRRVAPLFCPLTGLARQGVASSGGLVGRVLLFAFLYARRRSVSLGARARGAPPCASLFRSPDQDKEGATRIPRARRKRTTPRGAPKGVAANVPRRATAYYRIGRGPTFTRVAIFENAARALAGMCASDPRPPPPTPRLPLVPAFFHSTLFNLLDEN